MTLWGTAFLRAIKKTALPAQLYSSNPTPRVWKTWSFPPNTLFVKSRNVRSSASKLLKYLFFCDHSFLLAALTLQIGTDNTMLIWQARGLASCFPASKTNSPLWISQQDTVEHKAGLGPPHVPVYQGLSFIDSGIVALIKIFHASENSTAAKLSLIRVL